MPPQSKPDMNFQLQASQRRFAEDLVRIDFGCVAFDNRVVASGSQRVSKAAVGSRKAVVQCPVSVAIREFFHASIAHEHVAGTAVNGVESSVILDRVTLSHCFHHPAAPFRLVPLANVGTLKS